MALMQSYWEGFSKRADTVGKSTRLNPIRFFVLCNKGNIELSELQHVVFCEEVAVADKAGLMNISLRDVQSGISADATSDTVPVQVVTLDILIRKYGITNVDLLHIDVEGAALPDLRSFPWGGVKAKKIFCEMHPYV
jgi:FkbM family methyltransferase